MPNKKSEDYGAGSLATFLIDNHKNRNLFEYFLQLLTRKEPVKYYEYLKSPEWKLKAQQAKSAVGWMCQRCGSTRRLECHHKTYERLGRERMSDLEVLCHACHERISK